jgi:predicted aldo/keto reductase-like oxidoreductase
MKRRDFLKSSLVGGIASRIGTIPGLMSIVKSEPVGDIPKRPYKDGIQLSLIGFGGIAVMGLSQSKANDLVAEVFERGVNYFDVAPSYGGGEAEEKLGPALKPFRERVFLACKTERRDAAGAREELERSLRRMSTDHFDLYQFHAVTKTDDVKQIFAEGGALETLIKAREEGKLRYIGFSAHSEDAAVAMMERRAFDSVLFPVNFVCYEEGSFGPKVIQFAKERGVTRLALKAMAYTPWPEGVEHTYPKCWYRPIENYELAAQALRFTLSQEVTAAIPPGDERLYRVALDTAGSFTPLTATGQAELLSSTKGLKPIFRS